MDHWRRAIGPCREGSAVVNTQWIDAIHGLRSWDAADRQTRMYGLSTFTLASPELRAQRLAHLGGGFLHIQDPTELAALAAKVDITTADHARKLDEIWGGHHAASVRDSYRYVGTGRPEAYSTWQHAVTWKALLNAWIEGSPLLRDPGAVAVYNPITQVMTDPGPGNTTVTPFTGQMTVADTGFTQEQVDERIAWQQWNDSAAPAEPPRTISPLEPQQLVEPPRTVSLLEPQQLVEPLAPAYVAVPVNGNGRQKATCLNCGTPDTPSPSGVPPATSAPVMAARPAMAGIAPALQPLPTAPTATPAAAIPWLWLALAGAIVYMIARK